MTALGLAGYCSRPTQHAVLLNAQRFSLFDYVTHEKVFWDEISRFSTLSSLETVVKKQQIWIVTCRQTLAHCAERAIKYLISKFCFLAFELVLFVVQDEQKKSATGWLGGNGLILMLPQLGQNN